MRVTTLHSECADLVSAATDEALRVILWVNATEFLPNGTECTEKRTWSAAEAVDFITPEDRERVREVVEDFLRDSWFLLAARGANGDQSPERTAQHAGYDFILTSTGHGAGFWDGDWHNGDKLTEVAHSHPSFYAEVHVDFDGYISSVSIREE